MNNHYKSALNKLKLRESEKDRAKALFHEVSKEKETKMKVKKLFKPAVAVAACLALIIATYAIVPMFQSSPENSAGNTTNNNFFSVTAYAKELTRTGKVFPNKYSSLTRGICDADHNGISYCFEVPFICKGKNIDTITYTIKNGAFEITNPVDESVVIDGEKVSEPLNVPSVVKDGEKESEKKKKLTFEDNQYKSFTVDFDNQSNDKTSICVVDTSDIWSSEKFSQYRKFHYNICGSTLQEEKEVFDFLLKDMKITCTVTYKDGTTETKNIVMSNEIVRLSDVVDEKISDERDDKIVAIYFSME